MKNRVSLPTEIELLLRCYYSPVEHPESDERCFVSAAESLRAKGLLERECKCTLTAKGSAYAEAILRVAMPEPAWVLGDDILTRGPQ